MAIEIEDFPVLGEPFPIELANTRYRSRIEPFDFLDRREDVSTWFGAAGVAPRIPVPAAPSVAWHERLIALRDATRQCLDALTDGTVPPAQALDIIAKSASAATRRRSVAWSDGPHLVIAYDGTADQRGLATMADRVIDFLTGPDAALVRICAADDCPMLFVRHHHRRRWCHDGCGHRDRQARYYRRHRNDGAAP